MVRRRSGDGWRVLGRVLVTTITLVLAALIALVRLAPPQVTLHAEALSLARRIGLHDAVIKSSPDSNATSSPAAAGPRSPARTLPQTSESWPPARTPAAPSVGRTPTGS